jgi:hypothetical protein
VAQTQEIYLQARQLLAAEESPYSTVLVKIVDVEFTNVMPGKSSEYLVLPGSETGMERRSLSGWPSLLTPFSVVGRNCLHLHATYISFSH